MLVSINFFSVIGKKNLQSKKVFIENNLKKKCIRNEKFLKAQK